MSMTIANFVSELAAKGVKAIGEENKLRLTGNTASLTPAEIDWLRSNKPTVLAMLRMQRNPVTRYISLDGQCEAFSSHVLDPAYWRPAAEVQS